MDNEKGNFILLFIANNHVYNHTILHQNIKHHMNITIHRNCFPLSGIFLRGHF